MSESVASYQSVEQGQKNPVEGVAINPATRDVFNHVIPQGQTPEEYIAQRLGFASGEVVISNTPRTGLSSIEIICRCRSRAGYSKYFFTRFSGSIITSDYTAHVVY